MQLSFYADDLVLLSSSKEGLQNCLNKLSDFCYKWKLLVNFNKTKCMLFNTQGRLIQHKFHIDGNIIENVRNYCYLGVNFSISGSFSVARTVIYKKGLKAFFKFSKSFNDKKTSLKTFLHIFDHTVKAVLMYGSEIWGCFHPNKLKSHKSF